MRSSCRLDSTSPWSAAGAASGRVLPCRTAVSAALTGCTISGGGTVPRSAALECTAMPHTLEASTLHTIPRANSEFGMILSVDVIFRQIPPLITKGVIGGPFVPGERYQGERRPDET